MLHTIQPVVTSCPNPSVHRMTFSNLTQSEGKSIHNLLVRLKLTVQDYEFSCSQCESMDLYNK